MSKQSRGNVVQDELAQAVAARCLPDSAQDRAEELLERLQQPVRLALLGLPRSGKSTLLNLLVGEDVLPEDVRLPTLELTHGTTSQSVCTMPDGEKQTLPHTDPQQIADLSPAFVEMQMPLPALSKISVLEVVAPNDPTALQRASQWAAKRCDIALWCTQGFGEVEQTVWAMMPDRIKDHAFLMLTKVDILRDKGLLDAAQDSVRSTARDEFNQILPIATTDALAARAPDGTVDKDKLRSSGGMALISAVLKHVELGRQSFVDMAEVLLLQHADLLEAAAENTDDSESPDPSDAAPQHEEEVIVADTPTPTPTPVAKLTLINKETALADVANKVSRLRPETREAYEHVLNYIIDQSSELIPLVEEMGDTAAAQVMAKTVEHIQWLSDYLNEHGDEDDPVLSSTRTAAMDAADLVQLMQMEKRDSAAIEALSLMLQIKHELQAELAA